MQFFGTIMINSPTYMGKGLSKGATLTLHQCVNNEYRFVFGIPFDNKATLNLIVPVIRQSMSKEHEGDHLLDSLMNEEEHRLIDMDGLGPPIFGNVRALDLGEEHPTPVSRTGRQSASTSMAASKSRRHAEIFEEHPNLERDSEAAFDAVFN